MSFVFWKLERTPFIGNTYVTANTTVLTVFQDPILEMSLSDTKDSFALKIPNNNNQFNSYFNLKDKITIYRALNKLTVTSDDILMVGAINDIPASSSDKSNELQLKGNNYSETIMQAVGFGDVTNKTIPFAIKQLIEEASNMNPNFQVVWDPSNPLVKSNGDAFPTLTEKNFYTPLYKVIEKYSSAGYTNDDSYMWYIDNFNNFKWFKASNVTSKTFNQLTSPHTSIRYKKDLSKIYNFLIVKGGTDPKGRAIQFPVLDQSSIASKGQKFYYFTEYQNLSQNINDEDMILLGDKDRQYGRLPSAILGSSYSFVSSWGTTVTDDVDYVTKFTAFIKGRLKSLAKDFINAYKNGLLLIDIEVISGSYDWRLGDYISITVPFISNVPKKMRVKDIQYSSTYDVYSLAEDPGKGTL
jgi:hypothetical protein